MTANLDPAAPIPPKRRRWRRRLILWGLGLVALVIALPWVLNLGPVRALVVGRINARLAPGSVVVQGWSVGWMRPIRAEGVSLVAPGGKQVAAARSVEMQYGLLGLLLARPDLGRITIEGANVDVERRVDGTIDILDALANLLKPDPADPTKATPDTLAVRVVVRDGQLRASSPELPEPIIAGDLAATLSIAPGRPHTLAATLTDGARSLQIDASVAPPAPEVPDAPEAQAKAIAAASDLDVRVVGKAWPLGFRGAGGSGRGDFAGTLAAKRTAGRWAITTVSALDEFAADGPAFRGDHPRLGRVTLVADVAQRAESAGWSVARFELGCPVARAQAQGAIPPVEGTPTAVHGQVDLVALGKLLPRTLRLQDGLAIDRGVATLTANLTGAKDSERAEVAASVRDFAATRHGRAVAVPEFPRLEAIAVRTGARVAVEKLAVAASGIDVTGAGDLDAGVTLKGTIDLDALDAQVRDFVDLGALKLAGHARLAADYRRVGDGYKARVAGDCRDLVVAGLTAAPIHSELARLDASATGHRGADGRPTDLGAAKLDIRAGDFQVDLAASREADGTLRVGGLLATDLPGAGQGWVETKLAARWRGDDLAIDEGRAWVMPTGSKTTSQAGPHTLALAVRGRVDLAHGSAAFEALPDVPPGAIGVGPGGLKVSGWRADDRIIRLDAGLIGDLAILDRFLAERTGQPPRGWAGPWSSRILVARDAAGSMQLDAQVGAADLFRQGAATLRAVGSYRADADTLDLATANLATRYGVLASRLTLAQATTARNFDWSGTLDPHWDVIGPILAQAVEPNLKLDARPRPFHLLGAIGDGSLAHLLPTLGGEMGLDVASVTAFGVRAGPLPLVLHLGGGHAKFDPIATHVNGGPALLQMGLLADDAGGVALHLDESRVDDAAINDAVSSSVLAFIAPILSRATEVNGRVSVVLTKEGATIPLMGDFRAQAQGVMAFQDVVFRPGPLGDEVFRLTGQAAPKLAFAEPVQFSVIDGRVQQSGLTVPLPGGSKVEFAGSVGFDRTLRVDASVPITAAMVGRDAEVEKMLNGLKVRVPIGGTLARPSIDRPGLQAATRDAIRTVANREVKAQTGRLVDRVAAGIRVPGLGTTAPGAATGSTADPKNDLLRGLLEGLEGDATQAAPHPER